MAAFDDYFIPGTNTSVYTPMVDALLGDNPNPPEFAAPPYYPTQSYSNNPYTPEFDAPPYTPTSSYVPSDSSGNAGNWLTSLYNSTMGPGTALGGRAGAFSGGASGGMGAGGQGFLPALMSIGSGIYGMNQADRQRQAAQRAIAGSSPWTSSGGQAAAGTELTRVMQGDFTNDPGFKAAQLAASRTSSQQPGGFAAQAAAQAALKYQNDRIQALGAPAGVGFSPAAGYQTALGGMTSANDLASRSLGSIGYGMTGTQPMPPWLQQYLITNGMGGK
jgi:hypothetical protein